MSTAAIDSPYAWARLGVSMLLATIGCAGMWIIVVVLPAIQVDFGVNRAGASFPYPATMVGFAVGNVVIGRMVDRMGYFLPALASSIAVGLGLIIASQASSILVFTLAHGVLIGIGCAAMFGPLIADISHWFVARRGFAVACAACGNYIAGALWPAVTPWMMSGDWGWRGAYLAVGVISLVTMIPLTFFLRRSIDHTSPRTTTKVGPLTKLSLTPGQLQAMLVIAGFGCCMAMAMPQVHIVAYCADLGYGVARGAEMLALMLVGGVVSRLGSGILADRIGGIRTLLIGSIAQCLALAAYIPFDGLAPLYIVSLVFGLSQGGIVPCYAVIVREYLPAQEAGKRIGLVIFATVVGMAVGGWVSGEIYDWTGSYAAAFLNGIAWNLLNIVMMLYILTRDRKHIVATG